MARAPYPVVIVDDAAEVRALVRIQLAASGRFVVVGEGSDGRDAIELAARHRPAVLLLDVSMPGLDGLTALPLIRAAAPDVRVVMYTALSEAGLEARARQLGADGLLEKSAPLSELAERLVAIIGGQEATERALAQSEERFRLLVEAVEDYAIFMLDPHGYVESWNTGAERIKGYTAEEIVGQHFRVFYPPDKQRIKHPEHELELALRDGHYEEEGWRIRKDGSRFWANVLITAVRDGSGRHVGFAKVTRNIDERRRLQTEREQAAAALADANAGLAAANDQLAQEAADRAQLLAVTAHELRAPVSVLSGAAGLLAERWDQLSDTERGELLQALNSGAARLQRLLSDLLTAARLESSAIQLQLDELDVAQLLARTVARSRSAHPDVRIDVHAPPGLRVCGDADRLAQAVDNLLSNAIQHGHPPIQLRAQATADGIEVVVSDCGSGVSTEIQPKLFQRFAGQHGGTGLGLFIVRELLRAHGGDARYASQAGGGARFVLSLPAIGPQPAGADPADRADHADHADRSAAGT